LHAASACPVPFCPDWNEPDPAWLQNGFHFLGLVARYGNNAVGRRQFSRRGRDMFHQRQASRAMQHLGSLGAHACSQAGR